MNLISVPKIPTPIVEPPASRCYMTAAERNAQDALTALNNPPKVVEPSEQVELVATGLRRGQDAEKWALIDAARAGVTAEDALVNEVYTHGTLFGLPVPDILRMDRWPHDTGLTAQPSVNMPRYWLRCCVAIAEGIEPELAAARAGLSSMVQFYSMTNRYREQLTPIYKVAKTIRSHQLVAEAGARIDDDASDWKPVYLRHDNGEFVLDKDGQKIQIGECENKPKIKRDEMRARYRMDLAAKLNREEYGEKQIIETTSKSLNINMDIEPGDLLKMTVEEIQLQIGRLRQGE